MSSARFDRTYGPSVLTSLTIPKIESIVNIDDALKNNEWLSVGVVARIAVNKRSGIAPECHPDIRSRY